MRTLALSIAAGLISLTSIFFIFSATASDAEFNDSSGLETAVFAGGCFWCSEADFEKLDGVVAVISGYTGGTETNPTYAQVSANRTSHTEAVEVRYDPSKVSYSELLEYFWRTIDPTQRDGQFCDKGRQYRTGIFYLNETQQHMAEASLTRLNETKPFDADIVTEVTLASTFYPAEESHQDYYKRNSTRYKFYRWSCGRDERLKELWGTANS